MVTLASAADPTYRRELGNGLVQRWSTQADTEKIAQLCGIVFRDKENDPSNNYMLTSVRGQMSGDHPLMGPGDYAVIEDTSKEGNPIIACTCLWRRRWEYEGIAFDVGQPEFVATHPDYRNRGLIRRLFEMVHARSEAEGHLVQGITGIPYFYRQFGYEYALDLEGRRVTYSALIPKAQESTPEPYTLRAATFDDIPLLMELYNRQQARSMVWSVLSERFWRYYLDETEDPSALGKQIAIKMIIDTVGVAQGYVMFADRRWGSSLNVYALNIVAGANWQAIVPSLLRALQSYGIQLPDAKPGVPPFNALSFCLGSAHPLYEALGEELAPFYEPPYAWYIRVPDVLAFLRHIAPVLERRLANSAAASFTGKFTIDFFRGGLSIIFDSGRIKQIEPWRAPLYQSDADAICPALVFLQLLFGYRSLDELRYAYPDVRVEKPGAGVVLNALFPKKFSWVPG
ncbi:MAG TPA: GNAT family N-acetyltransferase [Ktedonobacteraceae bacterium]|nr:GNAT family N-acetyltransferase [Ktedonobacteraceae bacterium]